MRGVVRFAPLAREQLITHCRSVLPNEACGYLVGDEEHVERFVPVRNAAASPSRFVLDVQEQLAAEHAIDAAGETIVGIAHSHPIGDNYPSPIDVEDARRFDPSGAWVHVVVSPAVGSVRAFRILDGDVEELSAQP